MNNLKAIREEKGMTLAQLAERSGVARETLKKIEDGETVVITNGEAKKIADALATTFSALFSM